MSTFFEKLWHALSFLVQYLWAALKAIGRFLLWLGRTILHGLSALITWIRLNMSPRGQTILLAVVVAVIVVGAALIFTGHGCSGPAPQEETPAEEEAPVVTYSPNETDVQSLNANPNTITSFSLVQSGNQMYPELSEEDNKAITSALSIYKTDNEDVGFLIMNLNTGSGYCYNIDTEIYGASTYKGPLSVFLCEEYIDAGNIKKSSVSERIENSIIWSDNNSYRSLKHGFDGSTHNEWLLEMDIDPSDYSATFPTYSVRDSATLWMHAWEYLNSDSDTAEWLKGLFSRTETSFLRTGAIQAGMENATVYNKAGWCVSSSEQADSVNDAGIVVDGDNAYLVVAFSSEPDSPRTEANLANLFEALLNVRHSLDASNATWDNVEYVEVAPAEGEGASTSISVEGSDGNQYEIVTAPSDDASASSDSGQIIIDHASGAQLAVEPASEYELVTASEDGISYRIAEVR
ncbi:serine hydrolase [Anaerotardibacter muris]|uniref:serine hydrolase n=1 Tax=Anaerotardibacter muris TaxID=2941505 RepID=UPI00203FD236|nr:serine hydrolase [Anaerotardibacter muris]